MSADNVQLDGRGEDGEKSAADRRRPHKPVFPAVMSNVVFATVTGTFYGFARQQVEVLPHQRGDPRILKLSAHQGVQQLAHGSRGLDGILLQRAGQQFHAVEGCIHRPKIKDQGRICPCIFHVEAHQCYFSAAGKDGVEPGLQAICRGIGVFTRNQPFGGKHECVRRGFFYGFRAGALANGAAGAAGGNSGRQQPECFVHILMYLRVGVEALLTPEDGSQAIEDRRFHIKEARNGPFRIRDGGEKPGGIVFSAWRRQPVLEQPAGDFPEQRVLGRDARFREEGNGIKRGEHRPACLLKSRLQGRVLVHQRNPARQTVLKYPLGTRLPDAAKEIDQAAGLGGRRARRAESLRLPSLLGLGPRRHKSRVRLRFPETSQIRNQSHGLGFWRRSVEINDA
jgi:hypothetical protein